jgi:hypothetical protein
VLAGLLVPGAVAVRAIMLRQAADAARSSEEDAFAQAHGLTVERTESDELDARTTMRSEVLRIELAKSTTTITVVAALPEGRGRFWIQPDLVVRNKEKTHGLTKQATGDEVFDGELSFYSKAGRELPRALGAEDLKRALLAMRPLESGLRIERSAHEVVVIVDQRISDPRMLARLVDITKLIAEDAPARKLVAPPQTPSLDAKARLWKNVARVGAVIAVVAFIPGAALPPVSTLGDVVSCPPGQKVGSHSTGAVRVVGSMRPSGNTTLVCMTPKLEITDDAGLWVFVVSFEIYFMLAATIVAAVSMVRRRTDGL